MDCFAGHQRGQRPAFECLILQKDHARDSEGREVHSIFRSVLVVGVAGFVLAPCSSAAAVENSPAASAVLALADCVLEWSILATLIPAFFLGALIKVAVPSHRFLRCLGPQTQRPTAYGAALGSGVLLSLCSCNIVPLFGSIWRSGAGTGPAFALLYAGPAVNVVAVAYVCKLLGFGMGLWRVAAGAIMSVLLGLAMGAFFPSSKIRPTTSLDHVSVHPGRGAALAVGTLLLLLIVLGFAPMAPLLRLTVAAPTVVLIGLIAWRRLEKDCCTQWLRESGAQVLRTLPILVVVVLTLGYVAALVGPASTVVGGPAAGAVAAAGGTLMYFPVLTDTALVKSFGWGSGPAMVVLLAAPGLSLPGMFGAGKEVGVKRVVCYAAFVAVLAFALGMPYGLL